MKKQFAQLLYDIGFLFSAQVKDRNANRLSSKNALSYAISSTHYITLTLTSIVVLHENMRMCFDGFSKYWKL